MTALQTRGHLGRVATRVLALLAGLQLAALQAACTSSEDDGAESRPLCGNLYRNDCGDSCDCPSSSECVVASGPGRHCVAPCSATSECAAEEFCHNAKVLSNGQTSYQGRCNPFCSDSEPCPSGWRCIPEDTTSWTEYGTGRVVRACTPLEQSTGTPGGGGGGSSCDYSACLQACSEAGGTDCGEICKC